ncbi:unnamed protein product [Callosobruchus maculatus]|uniref:Uncharacterized protein n=1 Tax=Callosobruchus maculatus TaxID=64391 RepID=A0A653CK71_CALMS|nr:unnamed protein product [Callosobruchus maculatus]
MLLTSVVRVLDRIKILTPETNKYSPLTPDYKRMIGTMGGQRTNCHIIIIFSFVTVVSAMAQLGGEEGARTAPCIYFRGGRQCSSPVFVAVCKIANK